MRRLRSIAVLSAALLVACADQTALLVEVSSPDLAIPTDVDGLQFQAHADGDTMADIALVVTGGWPQSLAIRPGSSSPSAEVEIAVTALHEGVFVLRRVVRARFEQGTTVTVPVVLERACVGMMCPPGIDCVAGDCVEPAPLDGGTIDAGATDDGGRLDGGSGDGGDEIDGGGRADGGRRDGGPRDAGCSAATEMCGGGDEDCDGRTDESLPCPGTIVLSEVATGGPGGASDELVEVYNRSAGPIPIDGLTLEYRPATSTGWSNRATAPAGAMVAAHGYYLFGSAGYTRTPARDTGAWTSGFAQAGGHLRIVARGAELDRLGWGSAMELEPEGTPVAALSDDRAASYERKATATSTAASMASGGADERRGNGEDTNMNAADFVVRTSAEPQSTASPAETP